MKKDTNTPMMIKVDNEHRGGIEDRLPGGDGGHFIAIQFYSPGDIGNLVPQNS